MRKLPIIKSILFILLCSIFQPYFDVFLLFQYGPNSNCIDCFIIQQTFLISLQYLALPLIMMYGLIKIIKWHSILAYSCIGIAFAFIAFNKISIPLFRDRIAAWSTYSESEIFMPTFIMAAPTLLFQIIIITWRLYKINKSEV